jgi:hypothetical protein
MHVWTHHMLQLLATSVAILVPVWVILNGHFKKLERDLHDLAKLIAVLIERTTEYDQ